MGWWISYQMYTRRISHFQPRGDHNYKNNFPIILYANRTRTRTLAFRMSVTNANHSAIAATWLYYKALNAVKKYFAFSFIWYFLHAFISLSIWVRNVFERFHSAYLGACSALMIKSIVFYNNTKFPLFRAGTPIHMDEHIICNVGTYVCALS